MEASNAHAMNPTYQHTFSFNQNEFNQNERGQNQNENIAQVPEQRAQVVTPSDTHCMYSKLCLCRVV